MDWLFAWNSLWTLLKVLLGVACCSFALLFVVVGFSCAIFFGQSLCLEFDIYFLNEELFTKEKK